MFQSLLALWGLAKPPSPQAIVASMGPLRSVPPKYRKKPIKKQRTLADLAARLKTKPEALLAFTPGYSKFTKPKRSGGVRTLFAPNPQTKALQKLVLRHVIGASRVHHAAFAYERGRGIKQHAAMHANKAVVVGLDIEDFFPSTRAQWIRDYFLAIGWDEQAAGVLTTITTYEGGLPQGAPTSPKLSNLVNFLLDKRLEGLGKRFGATYSRYADDIAFSFETDNNEEVKWLVHHAVNIIWDCGYKPHMKKKLMIRREHQRQLVTGLVVNFGSPRVSRETKRWLRAVEHRMQQGGEATLSPTQLASWKAFIASIEK
jgi:retron-type reverse transcriptase